MNQPRSVRLGELARVCSGRLIDPGRTDVVVDAVAFIEEADASAVTWVQNARYAREIGRTRAGAILGTEALLGGDSRGIAVADVELALIRVLELFEIPPVFPERGIHASAVVHETARLAAGVAIGAGTVVRPGAIVGENSILCEGVVVGAGVRVGRDCVFHPRVVVYDRCRIGDRVIIHAGAVIGADGFNYVFREGQHRRIPQIGDVVIEDDVEIGANSCIDRAKTGSTRIGRGTKIDDQVMVGHNSQVGPHCILIGQTGLSGSTRLGSGVVMGGRAGSSPGIKIGDGATLGAGSIAWNDLAPGGTYSGSPSRDHRLELRERARVRQLGELFENVKALTKRIAKLEAATADHPEPR